MEHASDGDVEHEKLRLDQERLEIEKQNLQQENRFLRRNSSVIIASFVPLLVAAISVVQMHNSSVNDRRERLVNYIKYVNEKIHELRASNDVTEHRQIAYMTSTILDDEDRCPTLDLIATTVATNRAIREIYEREATNKHCKRDATTTTTTVQSASFGSVHGGLIPLAAADPGDSAQNISAIYVFRQKDAPAAMKLTTEVRQKLNGLGYNVPGENDVDSPIAQNEIRYFNKRDAAAATQVRSQLASATGKSFVVQDYSAKQPGRPGFLEIYISQ